MFFNLFSINEATDIYNYLFTQDNNPYTLQQLALCLGLFGDYENAFIEINKAMNLKPSNFSFKNSQAILMFECNNKNHREGSLEYMAKAMKILEQCYSLVVCDVDLRIVSISLTVYERFFVFSMATAAETKGAAAEVPNAVE